MRPTPPATSLWSPGAARRTGNQKPLGRWHRHDHTGNIAHQATTAGQKLQVYPHGVVNIGRTLLSLTKAMGRRIVVAGWDAEGIVFVSTEVEIIVEYLWPPEGTAYVGIRKARRRFRK